MGKNKRETRKARKKFKKDYGISRKKAGKMKLSDFIAGPVTDATVRDGVKKAKKRKWKL